MYAQWYPANQGCEYWLVTDDGKLLRTVQCSEPMTFTGRVKVG